MTQQKDIGSGGSPLEGKRHSFFKTLTDRFSEKIADSIINGLGIAFGLLIAGSVGLFKAQQYFADYAGVTPSWTDADAKDTTPFDVSCEYRLYIQDVTDKCAAPDLGLGRLTNVYFYPQFSGDNALVFAYSSIMTMSVQQNDKGKVYCSVGSYGKAHNDSFTSMKLQKRCAAPRK